MTGSVRQDKDRGTWYFVADVPSPDGKRRQVRRRGFSTKKEAAKALAIVVADQARGTYKRPSRITLGAFLLDEWLPARKASIRPSTAAAYEQAIRNYVVPTIGAARLNEVDGAMLNALYRQLLQEGRRDGRREGGLSPKTVRNVHGILTKAFQDAVRWNRLPRNPCQSADPPRGAVPEMKAWTTEELRAFLASVATHRWAGIWTLLATTGMRRGEILGLRWSDVDLVAGTVTVRSTRIRFGTTVATGTPKTARGNRTVALGDATVTALKSWRANQVHERLLAGAAWRNEFDLVVTLPDGTPPNPESFSNLFHKLSQRAGLRPICFHDLRHSYASDALAAGVPVKVLSQRLGHADVAVALKVYAHVLPGDDEEAARRADAVLGLG